MRLLLVSGVILSVLVDLCLSSGWWMDQPYANSSEFNTESVYEENITLTCGDMAGEFKHWIRPDMTVMEKNSSDFFKVLYGSAGWEVDNNGAMHIIFVQEQHFGFYHCAIYDVTDYVYIKKAVNYKGAYFGGVWEIYEMNFIIGLSAGGGFLLACLLIFIVQHFFFNSGNLDYDSDPSRVAVELADDYSGLRIPDSDPPFYTQLSDAGHSKGAGVKNGGYAGGKESKGEEEAYTQL